LIEFVLMKAKVILYKSNIILKVIAGRTTSK